METLSKLKGLHKIMIIEVSILLQRQRSANPFKCFFLEICYHLFHISIYLFLLCSFKVMDCSKNIGLLCFLKRFIIYVVNIFISPFPKNSFD